MADLISRQDAIYALGEEPEIWNDTEEEWAYRNAWVEHIAAIKALPSADRPSWELDGYTEWLEEKLLECEPYILCGVVSAEDETWCETNCENMRPECLRKFYEICKKEKL